MAYFCRKCNKNVLDEDAEFHELEEMEDALRGCPQGHDVNECPACTESWLWMRVQLPVWSYKRWVRCDD